MLKLGTGYYLKNANYLGWGEKQLDTQRVELIRQFLIGKKVLDIGCGKGYYVDYLARKGFDVVGVDFVPEFMEEAKKDKQGKFIKADALKLPFNEKEFDSVLIFDILEHGDDISLLKEANRVASKRVMVIVPKKVDERLASSGVIFRHYLDKSHLREYEEIDLRNLAKKCGLSIKTIIPIHPLYNETIFFALFDGPNLLRKIVRKLVLLLLPRRNYPTEIFVVMDKR